MKRDFTTKITPVSRVLLIAALAGCGGSDSVQEVEAQPELATPRPNVVLITLDTTRADRIGSYGYEAARTETLDTIAARGTRFANAYAPMPLTIPSHATMFTGLNPYNHGVRSNSTAVLQDDFTTLAEVLQGTGYNTAASVAAFVTSESWGFSQGFDVYLDDIPRNPARSGRNEWKEERSANLVIDDALRWWEHGRDDENSSFLWVHLFDAHKPLVPPPEYLGEGIRPYDAEIAYVDDQIQRLVDVIGEEDTIWVIAGDHGEGLGGHVETEHGLFLYNGTQRVPFFMAGPGIEASVVEESVGLVDLLPTLLSVLDIEVPEGLDGTVQPGNPHPIYMETYQLLERFGYSPHVAVVDGPWKLIDTPRPELYDQTADIREENNLAESEPERVESMRQLLVDFAASPPGEASQEFDPETLARLAALGYVSGGEMAELEGAPDPKDRMNVIRLLQQADRARGNGEGERADDLLIEALGEDPALIEARLKLVRSLTESGDLERARFYIDEAMEHRTSIMVLQLASMVYGRLGDHDAAFSFAEQGVDQEPDNPQAVELLLTAMVRQGQYAEAETIAIDFLDSHPDSDSIAGFIGIVLAEQGRYEEAQLLLRQGMKSTFPRRKMRQHMAVIANTAGEPLDAIALLREELVDYADNDTARQFLIRLLEEELLFEEQLEQVEVMLGLHPEDPRLHHAKAQVLFNLEDMDGCGSVLEGALERFEGHPELLLLKANLLMARGQSDEGHAVFTQAQTALQTREAARAELSSAVEAASGASTVDEPAQ